MAYLQDLDGVGDELEMSEWAQPGPFLDVIQRQREYRASLLHQDRLAAVRRRVEEEGRAGPNDLTAPDPLGLHKPTYLHEKSIGVRTNIVWRWSCDCGGQSRRPMRSRKQAERSWTAHLSIMESREEAS